MKQLAIIMGAQAPALVAAAGERATYRFLEFSPRRSGTRTRDAPTRATSATSSPGWSAPVSRQLPMSHHNLEAYLHAYIDVCGLADDAKGALFRTIGRGTGELTATPPLPPESAYQMVGRRAAASGIKTRIGTHTFRAPGITAYLKNGGTLEKAAVMANHASTRTTQLYDRRRDGRKATETELDLRLCRRTRRGRSDAMTNDLFAGGRTRLGR